MEAKTQQKRKRCNNCRIHVKADAGSNGIDERKRPAEMAYMKQTASSQPNGVAAESQAQEGAGAEGLAGDLRCLSGNDCSGEWWDMGDQ